VMGVDVPWGFMGAVKARLWVVGILVVVVVIIGGGVN
jgi:hypothetical protein